MSFSSTGVVHKCIPRCGRNTLMAHLPLDVQQVTTIPQAVDGIGVSKLMGRNVGQADIMAAAGQCLTNTRRSNGLPLATDVTNEQRIEARRQGQAGAGLEPVFQFLGGLFVEENNAVHMGLATGHKAQAPALLDRNILNIQAGNLANTQAGIKGQRPDGQGANIQPVTFTLGGLCFQVVKEFLQVFRARRAGDKFGAWRALCQFDGIAVQPPALVKPTEPRFKPTVVIIDRGILQIAGFAINQELVNSRRGWRKVRAAMGAELVKHTSIAFNGLGRLAGLGCQEIGNSPIHGAGSVRRLNERKVITGRVSRH